LRAFDTRVEVKMLRALSSTENRSRHRYVLALARLEICQSTMGGVVSVDAVAVLDGVAPELKVRRHDVLVLAQYRLHHRLSVHHVTASGWAGTFLLDKRRHRLG